jgi:putative transposase
MRTQDANLGKGMGRLLGGYARRFNERHDREGQLWGERYHVTPIESEAHLVRAGVYVLLNPVRAALCERAEQWCWSSYRGTIGLAEAPEALDGRGLLLALGGDPTDARRALRAIVDGEAARIVAGLRAEPTVPG